MFTRAKAKKLEAAAIEEALSDLVIETIVEWFARENDEGQWWRVVCVCRHWKKVSIPVLRRVYSSRWPQLLLTDDGSFVFNKEKDEATRTDKGVGSYGWVFVSRAVVRSAPTLIEVTLSKSAGAYVGVMLLPKNSELVSRKTPISWDPYPNTAPPIPDGEVFVSFVMGCFSASCFLSTRTPGQKEPKVGKRKLETRTIGDWSGSYFVEYRPGRISIAGKKQIAQIHVDDRFVQSAAMDDPAAMSVHFCIGFHNSTVPVARVKLPSFRSIEDIPGFEKTFDFPMEPDE